jgi:hypothetical protein
MTDSRESLSKERRIREARWEFLFYFLDVKTFLNYSLLCLLSGVGFNHSLSRFYALINSWVMCICKHFTIYTSMVIATLWSMLAKFHQFVFVFYSAFLLCSSCTLLIPWAFTHALHVKLLECTGENYVLALVNYSIMNGLDTYVWLMNLSRSLN